MVYEIKLENKRVQENPNYQPTWAQSEDGARAGPSKMSTKHGAEREKHLIGRNVSPEDFEALMELDHSRLEFLYHMTFPTPGLSILSSGFAPYSGTGRGERIKACGNDPGGAYHSDDPADIIGKYPHSLATLVKDEPPGEFFSTDGTHVYCLLTTSVQEKGKHLRKRNKKKGNSSQIFTRCGEDHFYIYSVSMICLPPISNTITPVIGRRHALVECVLTPRSPKSDRWIGMSNLDRRT